MTLEPAINLADRQDLVAAKIRELTAAGWGDTRVANYLRLPRRAVLRFLEGERAAAVHRTAARAFANAETPTEPPSSHQITDQRLARLLQEWGTVQLAAVVERLGLEESQVRGLLAARKVVVTHKGGVDWVLGRAPRRQSIFVKRDDDEPGRA